MQLKLTFDIPNNLTLPLGHHAALQGFIYHLLRENTSYADFLHDEGYPDGAHKFKLFVFGSLKGKHSISNKKITYYDKVSLEVRSPKKDFCNIIMQALQTADSMQLFHQEIYLSNCVFSKHIITESDVNIIMQSPITLSTTYYENEKKKTRYISPVDSDFLSAFAHNIESKYRAAFQKDLPSVITIEPIEFNDSQKYVTKFNNIYITSWKGAYRMCGDPEILTFLYDSGIGSRNSQGFGMFDALK